jgi:hypothetical protein
MRSLSFLARRFEWAPFEKTLADAADAEADASDDALVAFLHVEPSDGSPEALRKMLKHLKWMANKRDVKNVVLHSFTHLGGESAEPERALELFHALRERLESTGYAVKITPFGWLCRWSLDVHGESLAKVYKAF